jgi:hypothetical protein
MLLRSDVDEDRGTAYLSPEIVAIGMLSLYLSPDVGHAAAACAAFHDEPWGEMRRRGKCVDMIPIAAISAVRR